MTCLSPVRKHQFILDGDRAMGRSKETPSMSSQARQSVSLSESLREAQKTRETPGSPRLVPTVRVCVRPCMRVYVRVMLLWNLASRLGWSSTEPQESSCLHLPCTGNTCMYLTFMILYLCICLWGRGVVSDRNTMTHI